MKNKLIYFIHELKKKKKNQAMPEVQNTVTF